MDETNLTAGDDAENVIAGRKNIQNTPRQRSDQNITFTNQDNLTLYLTLQDMRADIRQNNAYISDVNVRLDDLPNRVSKLEVTLKPEIVVKAATEASNISNRTMLIAMVIGFGLVFAAVLLVYWWRPNG